MDLSTERNSEWAAQWSESGQAAVSDWLLSRRDALDETRRELLAAEQQLERLLAERDEAVRWLRAKARGLRSLSNTLHGEAAVLQRARAAELELAAERLSRGPRRS